MEDDKIEYVELNTIHFVNAMEQRVMAENTDEGMSIWLPDHIIRLYPDKTYTIEIK